jgi:large subunit ribosomal protein L28
MSHKCSFSGVCRQVGNRVSHANNRKSHVFRANIQTRRLYIPELKGFRRIRLSTNVLRTIDKIGLNPTLKKFNITLEQVLAS